MSKNCPACENNVPAYKTKVGDVNLLCSQHLAELYNKLTTIIESQPDTGKGEV